MKRNRIMMILLIGVAAVYALYKLDFVISYSLIMASSIAMYFGIVMLSNLSPKGVTHDFLSVIGKLFVFILFGYLLYFSFSSQNITQFSFYYFLLTTFEVMIIVVSLSFFDHDKIDYKKLYIVTTIIVSIIFFIFYFNPDVTQYELFDETTLILIISIINIVLFLVFAIVLFVKKKINNKDINLLYLYALLHIVSSVLLIVEIAILWHYVTAFVGLFVLLYVIYEKSFKTPYLDTVLRLEESDSKVVDLMRMDQLTNIPNRSYLFENIDKSFRLAKRESQSIGILMVDLDDFKDFNEVFGQFHGDSILRRVAQVIQKACMRPLDVVGRYGGEEFIGCLPNSDFKGVSVVCERIHKEIHNLRIEHPKKKDQYLTVSIGFVVVIPDKDEDFKAYIQKTEDEMYKVKNTGKNATIGKDINKENENE